MSVAQTAVREQKEMLAAQNKEIATKCQQKEALIKAGDEAQLQIKQLDHKLSKLKTETRDSENKVIAYIDKILKYS